MSPSPPEDHPRRPRRLRLLLRALLALVLILGLALAFRRPLLRPLLIREAQAFATSVGGHLEIESVGGSFLDDLILEGVSWTGPGTSVQGARLEVRFSLWDALRGEPDWLQRIDVGVERVEVDLAELPSTGSDDQVTGASELPAYLPTLTLELGQLRLDLVDGTGHDLQDLVLELNVRDQRLNLAQLSASSGPDRISSTGLEAPFDFPSLVEFTRGLRGDLEVRLSDHSFPSIERIELDASFDDRGHATLAGRIETWGGEAVMSRGEVALGDEAARLAEAQLDLDLALDFDSVAPIGELLGRGPWSGELRGALEVSGPLSSPVGHLGARATSLVLEKLDLGDIALDLEGDGQQFQFALEGLGRSMSGVAKVLVQPAFQRIDLDDLVLTTASGTWRTENPARVEITPDSVVCEGLEILSDDGRLVGSLRFEPGVTHLDLSVDSFDLNPFEPLFLPSGWALGVVSGKVEGVLPPRRGGLVVELSTAELRPGADQVQWSLELAARADGARVQVERLEGRTSSGGRLHVLADLPFAPVAPEPFPEGEVKLELEAFDIDLATWSELLPPEGRMTGKGELDVNLAGTWDALGGTVQLDLEDLGFGAVAIPPELVPLHVACDVVLSQEVSVRELSVRAGANAQAVLSGAIALAPDVPRLVGEPQLLLDAPLALEGSCELADLEWVGNAVEAFGRVQGRAVARGQLLGTLGLPSWKGELELTGGQLRLAADLPALREIEARLSAENRLWTIEELTGEVGGAPFRLSGSLDRRSGKDELDLAFVGERILLLRTEDTKVRADATLAVKGAVDALAVSGEMILAEGRYVRSIDLLRGFSGGGGGSEPAGGASGISFSLSSTPPLSTATFDVRIKSGAPFLIRNNIVRMDLRPDLRLMGTGEVLVLRGPIYVDRSTVALPSGRFQIASGVIEFRRDSPFVPELSLKGEMRSRGYDIDAQIAGPYNAPEVVLSSNPPLPNSELLLLFLTGQTPSESPETGMGAAETVAVYLAQDALSRWLFESDLDADEEILDRVEIEVGAEVSRSGSPTARGTYFLRARPKGIGKATYITAERDPYDRINYGFGILFRFR